ncbi:hypothetical protein D1007_25397 [Hordeum vulgare]|nr:hypothetical protein D1007_25397 [Hordeum vulgare]
MMDEVAGLMRNLKLSQEEKKSTKIQMSAHVKGKSTEVRAVGKVMSKRPTHLDALGLSLGHLWCPIKGTGCHGEKDCSVKAKKGERAQFGNWIMADMGKRRASAEDVGSWTAGVTKDGHAQTDKPTETSQELNKDLIPPSITRNEDDHSKVDATSKLAIDGAIKAKELRRYKKVTREHNAAKVGDRNEEKVVCQKRGAVDTEEAGGTW